MNTIPLKCDVCGQFIPYSDLRSGEASCEMVFPDSEMSVETYETLCFKHNMRKKMEVLKYLHKHSLYDLHVEYGIKIKEYPDHHLAVLNYNQIDSPKFHPIVRECRGLIIDYVHLIPVSRTFDRFFNLNEDVDDPFLWTEPFRVEEKADGSLMSVYFHYGKWRIASRGNAFAEGTTATGWSFHGTFESIIGTDINTFMKDQNNLLTFTFEMCSVHNKVVKLYEEAKLYLIGVHTISEGELNPWMIDFVAEDLGVHRPKVYKIKSVDGIHKSFEDFEATEEGYVLIDERGNRIKIKNPAYVDLHHLKGNGEITPKRITDVVFRGETEEVLGYFPEYRKFFEPWQNAYDLLIKKIDTKKHLIENESLSQKEFALGVIPFHYSGVLFSLRKGLTLDESFAKIGSSGKVQLLEKLI